MSSTLRSARVLVTGGSGFIGTNAVGHFVGAGCEVLNLDIRAPRNPAHAPHWIAADILDRAAVDRVMREFQPDYLLHLAARTDLDETTSLSGYAANIAGVTHTLEAASGIASLRRVIVASSRMVCRIGYQPTRDDDYCPPNLYGESKVQTERIVRAGQWPFAWTIVRPTSIWGPWFEIPYRTFFTTIQRRQYVNPSGHDPLKSFGFVGNTVHQLERLLTHEGPGITGGTMYLCDYPPLQLRAWADLIRRAMGLPPIRTVPVGLLRAAARVGDLIESVGLGRAPLTSFRLDNLLMPMTYPTARLEAACGALPFGLDEGVEQTVRWMRGPGAA